MRERLAKALGRWCDLHQQIHRHVPVGNGGCALGCPDCLSAGTEMREAIERMIDLVRASEREVSDG